MKISVIGAGNVGSLTALHIVREELGDIVLVDKIPGLAKGKILDLEDAKGISKYNYNIEGTDDINQIKNSDIVVITAGFTRKPGMTREELVNKNAQVVKEVSVNIKKLASNSIVIVVTNPLDLMTYLALKITGFKPNKVIGMGVNLDATRFSNLISKELNIPTQDIEAVVIAGHGEGMLPLPRLTRVKGKPLTQVLDAKRIESLINKTINRGAEIISYLGTGSAYFAPSEAAAQLIKIIVKDEKRILGVCTYVDSRYGLKDICIGLLCRLGKEGIEEIIELDLDKEEKETLNKAAESIRKNLEFLKPFIF